MADFMQAYNAIIAGHEGGYVDDETDLGGETYKGVSRIHNPDWPGWRTVDAVKAESGTTGINALLEKESELQSMVYTVYKQRYWDSAALDHIEHQKLAETIFDINVNCGRGINFLQKALNKLNENGALWSNVAEDNRFGPATYRSLKECLSHRRRGADTLVRFVKTAQALHYWRIMDNMENQERYAVGWLNRAWS